MAPVLTVENLSKSFSGPRVLDGVSLSIEPGEVRALVGQNGSGKSTLIKILAGFHLPDSGAVQVDGKPLHFGVGSESDALGLRFVHQDLGLVDNLDTTDNLALGGAGYASYSGVKSGVIRWRAERKRARKALDELGYDFDVKRPVGELAMSERTAVAIARALAPRGAPPKLLVLDEPTANLPAAEAERLYKLTRRVADSGIAVVFVSHHFDEVFELSTSVTVLRDGKLVTTRPVEGLSEEGLIELVIGRPLENVVHDVKTVERQAVLLEVSGVGTDNMLSGIDLTVHAGEIVGIAGITGSGRDEIAPAIFGGVNRTGEVKVDGKVVPRQRADLAVSAGVGLVPAQRHANAAFMSSSLRENITVTKPGVHFRGGFLRRRSERSDVNTWLERLDVRPRNCEFAMSDLSGGNQQKVVICRWLRMEPKVLILDEPTQGVDVGAKADIHRLVDEAAEAGTAVLVASTDHEELVRLCHRVLVMRRGRIVDELSGSRLDPDAITAVTIGRDQQAVA
jgi:ribose transport system ATP-binding protein